MLEAINLKGQVKHRNTLTGELYNSQKEGLAAMQEERYNSMAIELVKAMLANRQMILDLARRPGIAFTHCPLQWQRGDHGHREITRMLADPYLTEWSCPFCDHAFNQ